jgi:hypothetical protein
MRVAKAVPVTCADSIVIFLGEDPIVVPMVRNHWEPISFMDLSMPSARKQSAKKTVRQGCQRETKSTHTLDDSGLKKEIEQRIAKLETMVKVASSSTIEKLYAMEVAMGMMVRSVTWILENCLVGKKTTHGDPKELDEVKGASSIVDLGMEVSTADQVNDKAIEALGTLEQL